MNIYITRVDTNGAEDHNGAPVDAIFSVTIDGRKVLTESGGTYWFRTFDSAADAVFTETGVNAIRWIAQYDSAWGEALDEPCGYVGRVIQ